MRHAAAGGPAWAVVAAVACFWAWFHLAPPRTAFLTVNSDPEVPYFLTSLAVFKGQPYAFVDHPGAPLALIGTAVLAAARPLFHGPDAFVMAALRRPGLFMLVVHALLLGGTIGCMRRLARLLPARSAIGGAQAAALAAAFFAVLPAAFTWPAYWSHNAVAFPLGTLLLAGAWDAVRRDGALRPRTALLLGAGAGTLAAIQVYFAVWVVGLAALPLALALFARRAAGEALRGSALVVGGALVAFAAWTAPLLPVYPRFLGFVARVITHQGIYGTGAAGFSSFGTWVSNIAALASAAPFLFAALAGVAVMLGAGMIAGGLSGRRAPLRAMAAALALHGAVLLVLLGKHPSVFYLPALAALLPPLLALAFTAWRGRRGRALRLLASLAVLAAFAANLAHDVAAHRRRLRFREAMEREVSAYARAHASGAARPLLLWGPLLRDARCYALWMGEQYTGRALGAEISALCPDEGLAWSNSAALPHGRGADEPALLVTTEAARALFPAFRALGEPELSPVRDPAGHRLAFYAVAVREGRVLRRP